MFLHVIVVHFYIKLIFSPLPKKTILSPQAHLLGLFFEQPSALLDPHTKHTHKKKHLANPCFIAGKKTLVKLLVFAFIRANISFYQDQKPTKVA